MITLGFFFVMSYAGMQIGLGPYADEVSCYAQAQMMEQAGEEIMTTCYQSALPDPDSGPEISRDSRG